MQLHWTTKTCNLTPPPQDKGVSIQGVGKDLLADPSGQMGTWSPVTWFQVPPQPDLKREAVPSYKSYGRMESLIHFIQSSGGTKKATRFLGSASQSGEKYSEVVRISLASKCPLAQ